MNTPDQVSLIMAYEQGELDAEGTVELFSQLIKSGLCWQLQGHYGRAAHQLIESGVLSLHGEIDHELLANLLEET